MRYLMLAAASVALLGCNTTLQADPIILERPSAERQATYTAADGERACRAQARSQRLEIVRIVSRTVQRRGPIAIGSTIQMQVRQRGRVVNATCTHTRRTNEARIVVASPPPATPDYSAAERACAAQARREGLSPVRVTSRAPLRRGPAVIGARLGVELRRGSGRPFAGTCDWTIRTGAAALSYTEPRPPVVTPDYAAAERACRAQARREGLTVVRFVSPREAMRRGPALLGARLGVQLRRGSGRVFNGTCEWTIRTGAAVLRYSEPPAPRPDPVMDDAAALRVAERACTAHFAATAHPIASVRHRRLSRDGSGRPLEARIDVLREGMPFREDFFRCTYNFPRSEVMVRQLPR